MLLVEIYINKLQCDHNSLIDLREKSKMTRSHKCSSFIDHSTIHELDKQHHCTSLHFITINLHPLLMYTYAVAGSISLTMANYDAYESDGEVSVCAVLNAEALERRIIVQLSSQDSTARSKIIINFF